MKKNIWDYFAPFYELAMKSQKNQYDYLYEHILPLVKDKKALSESRRGLKDGGIFIAPNFIGHSGWEKANLWTKFLETLGVKFQKKLE